MIDQSEKQPPIRQERAEILRMLADRKITAQEAAELLSAMRPANATTSVEPPETDKETTSLKSSEAQGKPGTGPSWLHVKVTDSKSGRGKVTVNIPLRLVKAGIALGSRFSPELEDLNWSSLADTIGDEKGVLVDVLDEEDGEHVQIYVD